MDSELDAGRDLTDAELQAAAEKIRGLDGNLQRVIRGKGEVVELLITALLANGSVLMEDVPGLGKTTLAKALAQSLDADYRRVQFTPDLLPADIVGARCTTRRRGPLILGRGLSFVRSCWPMKSIGRLRARSRRCWRRWRSCK